MSDTHEVLAAGNQLLAELAARDAARQSARQAAVARAQDRMQTAPLAVTDDDLAHLALVSPALAEKAFDARRAAQLALVRSHTAPVLETKTLAPTIAPTIAAAAAADQLWEYALLSDEQERALACAMVTRRAHLEANRKQLARDLLADGVAETDVIAMLQWADAHTYEPALRAYREKTLAWLRRDDTTIG